MILCTYSFDFEDGENRWKDNGSRDEFFASLDGAKQALLALRDEVNRWSDSDEEWRPAFIERVEIAPLDDMATILTLLNEGIGPLVRAYEIVATID